MRFKFLGSLLVVILAAIGLTSTALANDSNGLSGYPEPQTTNIPYNAWIGSQVRLTKCVPLNDDQIRTVEAQDSSIRLASLSGPIPFPLYRGNFSLEEWTGANNSVVNSPYFNNQEGSRTTGDVIPFFEYYAGPKVNLATKEGAKGEEVRPGFEGIRLCFSAHLTSPSSGLGVVKLAIRADPLGLFPGVDPQHKHLFLVTFLKPVTPVLTEETALNGQNLPVGDPDGVNFNPGQFDNDAAKEWGTGLAKVVVKGTFPYGNIASDQFPDGPALMTLPDDYAALAALWATDDDSFGGYFGSAPQRWDIHDDTTLPAEQHTSNICATAGALIDVVDNCVGNTAGGLLWSGNDPDFGPFSRYNTWHSYVPFAIAYPAVGPFDPLRPNTSFLPDGNPVNAGDANMPALRVDVNLSADSIGSLIKADKSNVYSRDFKGTATPHNLYAPFYKAYIPAAPGHTGGRSGVAGSEGNNYPAYLTDDRLYDYWDLLDKDSYQNPAPKCQNPVGVPYPAPYGWNHATIYTDEHGEGWIGYDPVPGDPDGLGNFNLAATTSGVNSICDVRPGVAGTATISAVAKLPDQPGATWAADKSLTKIVRHLGEKTLVCTKKPGFPGSWCKETILDLAGNPIAGAPVLFVVEAQTSSGASVRDDQGTNGGGPASSVTINTLADGTATVYVDNSFDDCVNVTAENIGTRYNGKGVGITRDYWIKPRSGVGSNGGSCTAPVVTPPVVTPPAPGGSSGGSSSSSGGSSSAAGSAVTVSLGGPVIQAQPVLQAGTSVLVGSNGAKLFSVKVLQTQLGRYLVVNVKGSAKTAKIRIAIMGKNGKVLKTLVRTVPTNKAFKIANYKLGKTAVSVRASVIA